MLAALPASACQSSYSLHQGKAPVQSHRPQCRPWLCSLLDSVACRIYRADRVASQFLPTLQAWQCPAMWQWPAGPVRRSCCRWLLWLQELFAKICGVSYIGDVRMGFAEDSRKVERIAAGSATGLAQMYNKRFKVGWGAAGMFPSQHGQQRASPGPSARRSMSGAGCCPCQHSLRFLCVCSGRWADDVSAMRCSCTHCPPSTALQLHAHGICTAVEMAGSACTQGIATCWTSLDTSTLQMCRAATIVLQ